MALRQLHGIQLDYTWRMSLLHHLVVNLSSSCDYGAMPLELPEHRVDILRVRGYYYYSI